MKTLLKTLLLALILLTVLNLAACGEGEQVVETPDYVYAPNYITMEDTVESFQNATYNQGNIYFLSYGVIGERTPTQEEIDANDGEIYDWMKEVYGTILYRVGIDGTGLTKLENYQPLPKPDETNMYSEAGINTMVVDGEGNLWVAEYQNNPVYDEDFNMLSNESKNVLRKLDSTGAELLQIDLAPYQPEEEDGWFYINDMEVDGAGNVYLSLGNDNSVKVMDPTGQLICDLKPDMDIWINQMIRLSNGEVAISTYDSMTDSYVLKPIDLDSQSFGQHYSAPLNCYNFYYGVGDHLVYTTDGSNLYGVKADGTSDTILNWIDCDVDNGNLQAIIPLDDGRVLCVPYPEYGNDGQTRKQELIMLAQVPYEQVANKTILTMATMWMDYDLRSQVIKFNKTNPNYRIQVTDYSQYNTTDDYTAGLTKLNTEIISGQVPDMLNVSQLPVQQYVTKGLLEDLYTYIDADSELGGREALVAEALRAMEINGGLYQASPSFSITTVLGPASVVGDEPGWTLDDLNQVLEEHPGTRAFAYATRDLMLYYSCMMGLDNYVDWQTGTCNFDSPSFIKLLEFANTFPEEFEWTEDTPDEYELIMEGKVLLTLYGMYDFTDIQRYAAVYNDDVVFKGFPTEEGCGSALAADTGLAMSQKCKDKQGAWSFMRLLLTEDYQTEYGWWGLPTNKKVFDDKAEEAMTEDEYTDEDGIVVVQPKYTMGTSSGLEIEVHAMSQETFDKFMDLLGQIDHTQSYDQSIFTIVEEEAAYYFAGTKTAADTAQVIQSRVNIYVNEQM